MVDKSRFYVDVNVFVYWLGNHPKYGQVAFGIDQENGNLSPRRICYFSSNTL